jgi:biofilm PGA synthesis N-glycosyltransferase PgaC
LIHNVAVLIASRNGANTIVSTIQSVLGQADIYVVSDASTDETGKVSRDLGVRVLELTKNVGKPTALFTANKYFKLTDRYDAVCILDDDTVLDANFILRSMEALKPDVAIVVGKTVTTWSEENNWNPWVGVRAYSYWKYQLLVRRGQSALNVMNCVSGSNSVYRSTVLAQVLTKDTPYIVDDTYWTLETHRRGLGKIVYAPKAIAYILDPLTGRDWYKQNLRWLWGTLQGIKGHRIGTKATLFDFMYILLILDWVLYVVVWPIWLGAIFWFNRDNWPHLLELYFGGYLAWSIIGAIALRKWRLVVMTPFILVFDWLYRINFAHALIRTFQQSRVESCVWDSPARS